MTVVTSFGYALSMIPFVKRHEDQVMTFLMILPVALLVAGLLGTLVVVIKRNIATPDLPVTGLNGPALPVCLAELYQTDASNFLALSAFGPHLRPA